MHKLPLTIALGAGTVTAVLAGCSSGSTTSAGSTTPAGAASASGSPSVSRSSSPSASSTGGGCPVSVSDAWVKAADSGVSAAFGVVRNDSSAEVTIVSASSPVSTMTQLHETTEVDGTAKMSEVGQLQVPANGDLTLEPGGNHIMFMALTGPVTAGQDVPITLTCLGGGTAEFSAQARTFTGANESYQPSASASATSGM